MNSNPFFILQKPGDGKKNDIRKFSDSQTRQCRAGMTPPRHCAGNGNRLS
jgi:hypothetical protein